MGACLYVLRTTELNPKAINIGDSKWFCYFSWATFNIFNELNSTIWLLRLNNHHPHIESSSSSHIFHQMYTVNFYMQKSNKQKKTQSLHCWQNWRCFLKQSVSLANTTLTGSVFQTLTMS